MQYAVKGESLKMATKVNEHTHKYLPITAKVVRRDSELVTSVILRCSCGVMDYHVIPGDWSISEITGSSASVETDSALLKRMGISA